MREILFRGKREDNGEWIEGNLFIPDLPNTPTQICIGTNVIRITYDVIPETVGQYTGLTDKNGKKIFEGDIIKSTSDLVNSRGEKIGKTITKFYEVVVTNDGCSATYGTREIGETYISRTIYEKNAKDFYEVISNIHDNPELMKGGE